MAIPTSLVVATGGSISRKYN